MSGKFMEVKKIFIPTLTALLIASQLTGCASASEKEMLQMINNQQSICIEVAVPVSQEQGEEIQSTWTELAHKDNYEVFRLNFDDTLGITAFGTGGKNGTVYVDLEGNHTDNSTFYYAMMNKKFREQLDDTDTNAALQDLAYENYTDINSDAEAKLAYINAYFDLINDAEPNYYNGNSTLTRAEFLGAIYKAQNPVSELEAPADFYAAVDPTGENPNTDFAYELLEHNYLNLDDKSLTSDNFNGTITRAEAVYTLVNMFYSDKLASVTGKEASFADIKNGGDIASKVGFIETTKDKETKEKITTYKDYWKAYELQYAIENADKGAPDDLYKAMVVAKQVGLITGDECRWDEALTKNEALNFILKIFESMDSVTNADRGNATGEIIDNGSQEGDGIFENPFADYTKTDESLANYQVTITEELNLTLYVIKEADILKLDKEGAGAISPAEIGANLTVTGKTSNDWYEVQWGQSKGYLPADVLSPDNPFETIAPDTVVNEETGMTAQETLEKFNEVMKDFNNIEGVGPAADDMVDGGIAPDYANDPW